MKRTVGDDYDAFRIQALQETGVSFCTRMHFGRPFPGESERYIRLAYSGIDVTEIEEGLAKFKELIEH
jgi:aspartate/methionine/tyrosine aminotransferase